MNIAIDARWIFRELSGIGQYTSQLIRHLGYIDTENIYRLIFEDQSVLSRFQSQNEQLPSNFITTLVPYGVFSPWSQVRLPLRLKHWKIDVYHSPNYMIPFPAFPRNRRGRIACVTTIHDVIPLLFPHHAPKSKKSRVFPLFVRIMREAGMRSDAIITVSHASARDIRQQLRLADKPTDRVHAIYNGVSPRFHAAPTPRSTPRGNNLRTLLYVGRMDPYKNLCALIKAFAQAYPALPFPVELLIVGAPDPRYPEGIELARQLGIEHAVRWTGYLSDDELVTTYQSADLLVHPSRYEGFGLQVLEAMACGVPVISSHAGALREVVGDAGITLDPDDVEGYASKILEVLTTPRLAKTLTAKGFARAREFSWERTATETLAVYAGLGPGAGKRAQDTMGHTDGRDNTKAQFPQ